MKVPDYLRERLEAAQKRLDDIHKAKEQAALRLLDDSELKARGANPELARRHLIEFIKLVWQKPTEPFVVGMHTLLIGEAIDAAIEAYRAGRSSFYVFEVPFRHGKSDLVSRYLPPKFLAEFPNADVLLTTYGGDLAADLSRFAKHVMDSKEFYSLFPGTEVSRESSAADRWGIEGHTGGMTAAGLGGPLTGRGYALGVVDDFLKSREEAESTTVEEARWEAFTNDFLTRRAPVSVTLVLTTRWTTDDPVARIEKAMAMDEKFPKFQFLKFPALSDDYESGTLFPERFDLNWYETQRATLGPYGFAGLMQQEPIARGGNMFKVNNISVVGIDAIPKTLRWVRAWDLASSAKQVAKRDPDYTVGVLMAVESRRMPTGKPVKHIWVADIQRRQMEAPERDRLAEQVAEEDGPNVRIVLESVSGYRDTLTRWKEMLRGRRTVSEYKPTKDKVSRSEPLLAIVEAGNFHILKASWNSALIEELSCWPYGPHDDQVDAVVAGLASTQGPTEITGVFEYLRQQGEFYT